MEGGGTGEGGKGVRVVGKWSRTEPSTDGAEGGGEEEDDAGFIFIQTVRRRSKGTRADAARTDAPEGLQQVRRGEDAAEQGQRR